MRKYPDVALEKPMTRHEIMLRAYAKESSWVEAAKILCISERQLRRIKRRFERHGYSY